MLVVLIVAGLLQLPLPTPPADVCVPTPITPCIPIPPPPCIPSPITDCSSTPSPPPPNDVAPVFPKPLVIVKRTKTTLTVKWQAAIDDHKVTRYMFMRDKKIVGWRAPTARKYAFRLVCGRHVYRVVAIDVYRQYGVNQIRIRRVCQ